MAAIRDLFGDSGGGGGGAGARLRMGGNGQGISMTIDSSLKGQSADEMATSPEKPLVTLLPAFGTVAPQ